MMWRQKDRLIAIHKDKQDKPSEFLIAIHEDVATLGPTGCE
jgi:hypothetical protein